MFEIILREGIRVQTREQVSLQFQAPQGTATFQPATSDLHINTENVRGKTSDFIQMYVVISQYKIRAKFKMKKNTLLFFNQ